MDSFDPVDTAPARAVPALEEPRRGAPVDGGVSRDFLDEDRLCLGLRVMDEVGETGFQADPIEEGAVVNVRRRARFPYFRAGGENGEDALDGCGVVLAFSAASAGGRAPSGAGESMLGILHIETPRPPPNRSAMFSQTSTHPIRAALASVIMR